MKNTSRTLLLAAAWIAAGAVGQAASYTVSWVGNSNPSSTGYVGNCARSMWVAPEGVVYTASMWDENGKNIGIYQNGASIGGMGGTNQSQGSAIGGNSTHVFTAQQGNGQIGRYNRTSKARDLTFAASTGAGDVIQGIAADASFVYVSDFAGNRVRVFTTAGVFVREWAFSQPGAITLETGGANVWVAQMATGKVCRYSTAGAAGAVIQMATTSRPSAVHCTVNGELWVGDQGPDMNIKIYTNLTATPAQSGAFGVTGGYLSTTGGLRGQTGAQRFTRVVGIGSDTAGKMYVLNNPWGGTWDLGRNGATDIHCYIKSTGALSWTLQSLNFEGVAAADPATDGRDLYSGNIIYTGSGAAGYRANTVDPFRYPADQRLNVASQSRGEHFGMLASLGGRRILAIAGQNTDTIYSYYFNGTTDGMIAIPGEVFGGSSARIRNGFCLVPTTGDVFMSIDKTNAIQYRKFTRFDTNNKPIWAAAVSTPTPSTIAPLRRLEYVPSTDTMVLAGGAATDWTIIGTRVEVYPNWQAGNRTPSRVITLSRAVAKSIAAAGNNLFVGYYAINNIDVFDLTTGANVLTMTPPAGISAGNDTDSMYGVRAYKKNNGTYLVSKDDYNTCKVVLYTFTP